MEMSLVAMFAVPTATLTVDKSTVTLDVLQCVCRYAIWPVMLVRYVIMHIGYTHSASVWHWLLFLTMTTKMSVLPVAHQCFAYRFHRQLTQLPRQSQTTLYHHRHHCFNLVGFSR